MKYFERLEVWKEDRFYYKRMSSSTIYIPVYLLNNSRILDLSESLVHTSSWFAACLKTSWFLRREVVFIFYNGKEDKIMYLITHFKYMRKFSFLQTFKIHRDLMVLAHSVVLEIYIFIMKLKRIAMKEMIRNVDFGALCWLQSNIGIFWDLSYSC